MVRPFKIENHNSRLYRQQSGAVVACWAHNPEVRGSKPRSAKRFLFFVINSKNMIMTATSTNRVKLRIKINIEILPGLKTKLSIKSCNAKRRRQSER